MDSDSDLSKVFQYFVNMSYFGNLIPLLGRIQKSVSSASNKKNIPNLLIFVSENVISKSIS